MNASSFIERIDALPSPSPLALRLLTAAQDDSASARDLVEIIRQDSGLTTKVLSLCRRGPRGRSLDVASLDRAVVLLGFPAVRAAALAVEFVGTYGSTKGRASNDFDALRFWRHSLAKAIVAEGATKLVRGAPGGGRAFVIGLLHDLGALLVWRAAPALCDRCCDEAERTGRALDDVMLEEIGLSASSLAARAAMRWNLPEELIETMRLRGETALVARGPYRGLVLLAELADRAVRRRHIGGAGFGPTRDAIAPVLEALAIDARRFEEMTESIFEDVAARAEALGLDVPGGDSASAACALAAESLERATRRLEASRDDSAAVIDVTDELDAAADPASVLACVVRQINRLAPRSTRLLAVSRAAEDGRTELREFGPDGALIASRVGDASDRDGNAATKRWCEARGGQAAHGTLALAQRGETLATLHSAGSDVLPVDALAKAPVSLWSFALAAALERERARRAAERSAEAARLVSACRDRIARDRALASVGEIAAGLAHELNNPLAVASGRAQLLVKQAPRELVAGLDDVVAATERASDLVAKLLRVVRPSRPAARNSAASEIIALALRFLPGASDASRVDVREEPRQPARVTCFADPAQAADALAEVVQNALAANPATRVTIIAECEERDGRCRISVRDSGPGFSERALTHALDPFFSERSSGRGAGLGLSKARSLTESSGGSIELRNAAEGGAIVTIILPGVVDCSGDRGARDGERGEGRGSPRQRRDAA